MNRIVRVASLFLAAGAGLLATQSAAAQVYAPAGAPTRAYSPFVKANGFIFVAGQVGTDSTGKLVTGGIAAETKQVMTNIKAVLDRNGSSIDHVVKCFVLLADINDRQAMSDVYITFFAPDKRPARTAAGVSGLALNARVEIECQAVAP